MSCQSAFIHPNVNVRVRRSSFVVKHPCTAQRRASSLNRCAKIVRATVAVGKDSYNNTGVEPHGDYVFKSSDGLTFHERAHQLVDQSKFPSMVSNTLIGWFTSYQKAASNNPDLHGDPAAFTEIMFSTLLELSYRGHQTPIPFESIHKKIRQPFDYYKFSIEFASILVDRHHSTVIGQENIHRAVEYASQGHNIIFLSNHQSEGDPYAIDLLLRWIAACEENFCEQIYFMAGDRVRDDPVVMPFSAGRNLLTVYSKKHMNDEPELRSHKVLHNKRTLSETMKMFQKGGHVVWMAPSGGRDRRNGETGQVDISPFDESSIDMIKLTAMKSGAPCHFFPMALWTYDMLPPPSKVGGAEKGEERVANFTPMHMHVGEELDLLTIVSPEIVDKLDRRRAQRNYIQKAVEKGYSAIGGHQY